MQTTSHILMIRPVNFGFNVQTAVNNAFQQAGQDMAAQEKAEKEFDDFATLLRSNGIDVLVVNDTPQPHTPDSIFPNNWISFHPGGRVYLYPMFAENRRQERKPAVLEKIKEQFTVHHIVDLSGYESQDIFLEGTGSMVLDHDNKIVYACLSPRTDATILKAFCRQMQYTPVTFTANDASGTAIYHTNVMMCVASRYVVICLECIPEYSERKKVMDAIRQSGKAIIEITLQQMNHFAGNMLQVHNNKGEELLVMSGQAYNALTPEQVQLLSSYNRILHSPLDAIETNGGGSARCMMAEVFLEKKDS